MGFVQGLDSEGYTVGKLRAKFKVKSVEHFENGGVVKMEPVTTGSPENEEFFKWTPSGEIKLGLVNHKQLDSLLPGKEFYIDLIPAE